MVNLNFKRGSYANLQNLISASSIEDGTFYLTEDTSQLFLGINANTVIEITAIEIKNELLQENEDIVEALNTAIGAKANTSDLISHISNESNPHNVTLSQLGVTATATELNYVDGVTSNIQTQLNAKADADHTHAAITEAQIDEICTDFASVQAIYAALDEIDALLGDE